MLIFWLTRFIDWLRGLNRNGNYSNVSTNCCCDTKTLFLVK